MTAALYKATGQQRIAFQLAARIASVSYGTTGRTGRIDARHRLHACALRRGVRGAAVIRLEHRRFAVDVGYGRTRQIGFCRQSGRLLITTSDTRFAFTYRVRAMALRLERLFEGDN